ncbi:uncharacterized protein L3040_007426 [Drepanopeziza brunnea f. sp. 'multigermtubi']|uniref:uncharacterized protein n=1 Tax=Drepanopeziza brunnea f. sp. 'multigermtubi' TaxID=698441 RepID=UPI00238F30D6|nr:hypothetical protein L3040_007426 [Drepanopeziza brunnea f. sp. 'multigermtubi']
MGRAKKSEEKPKESKDGPTLQIDVDHFVRTRDSVVSGLATLQDAIQTLSSAYIKHTNTVLVGHGAGLDVDTTLAKLVENPLLKDMEESADRAASPAKSVVVAAEPEKKERKKRLHDPNAPKRPLTPFFLYMKTARPIIASDLGPDAAKGAVSTEGTKRWSVMDAHQKYLWGNVYKDNLRLYNARMHAYKQGGNVAAKDMTDAEALAYAEEHNIGINPSDVPSLDPAAAVPEEDAEAEAEAEAETGADADADDEPEKEPTPPPKTPKAKNTRRSKGGKNSTPAAAAAAASPEAIMPPPSASSIGPPKPAEKEKSPEKKRKRGSKKEEEKVVVEEPAAETPKSAPKPRKKKTRSDS